MGRPDCAWLEKRITYERGEQLRQQVSGLYRQAACRARLIDELLEKWLVEWLEQQVTY